MAIQRGPIFGGTGADIQGGALVMDYSPAGSTDPASTVLSTLQAGYAQSPSKFATGALRSTVNTDPNKGLGWKDDTTAHQVSVVYTYYGDANLDGKVDTSDFTTMAAHFASSQVWTGGDFNYDGTVNALDFNAIASNFGRATLITAPPVLGALVPEPGSMMLLAGAATLLARRRRR